MFSTSAEKHLKDGDLFVISLTTVNGSGRIWEYCPPKQSQWPFYYVGVEREELEGMSSFRFAFRAFSSAQPETLQFELRNLSSAGVYQRHSVTVSVGKDAQAPAPQLG